MKTLKLGRRCLPAPPHEASWQLSEPQAPVATPPAVAQPATAPSFAASAASTEGAEPKALIEKEGAESRGSQVVGSLCGSDFVRKA